MAEITITTPWTRLLVLRPPGQPVTLEAVFEKIGTDETGAIAFRNIDPNGVVLNSDELMKLPSYPCLAQELSEALAAKRAETPPKEIPAE